MLEVCSGTWEEDKSPAKEPMRKHTSGRLAIYFSACEDSQIAGDTSVRILDICLSPIENLKCTSMNFLLITLVVINMHIGGKGKNCLLTFIFTKIINENPDITSGGLLQKMHEEIDRIVHGKRRHSFLKHVFRRRITQVGFHLILLIFFSY